MRYKVSVVILVEDEDDDGAVSEVEAQLADIINTNSSTTIASYEILDVEEVEIEEVAVDG